MVRKVSNRSSSVDIPDFIDGVQKNAPVNIAMDKGGATKVRL